MLVAIAVSLLVNDTPVDVLGYGALGCLALTAWEETACAGAVSARSAARAAFESRESALRIDRRSSRTTPARVASQPTVPSAPFERQPPRVVQYGDQFVAMR